MMKRFMGWFIISFSALTIAGLGAGWLFVNAQTGSYDTDTLQFEDGPEIAVELADTRAKQWEGLSGRDGLDDDEGMLFVYDTPASPTFWMRGMTFPIDIIWIRDREVIGIEHNVQPDPPTYTRYHPPTPVTAVLEVNAGFANEHQIQIGTALTVEE